MANTVRAALLQTDWPGTKEEMLDKHEEAARDAKMTGLVESGETYNELRGVELVGTGEIVDDYEKVLSIGKAVAVRYNGEAAISDAALPFIEAQAHKRLGVIFRVDSVVSWDHTKLSGGY